MFLLKFSCLLLCALKIQASSKIKSNDNGAETKDKPIDEDVRQLLETGLTESLKCIKENDFKNVAETFYKAYLPSFKLSDLIMPLPEKRIKELTKDYVQAAKSAVNNTAFAKELGGMAECVSKNNFLQMSPSLLFGLDAGDYSSVIDSCVKKIATSCNKTYLRKVNKIFKEASPCLKDIRGKLNKIYNSILPEKCT